MLISRRRRRRDGSGGGATSADHVVFSTQPVGANSGSALSTQPVVTAKKADGTTDTSYVGTVTVAINTVTGSHSLGGTTSKACVAGVATFTDLADTGSGDATLTATSPGLAGATSNSFTTAAASADLVLDTSGVVQHNSGTITIGTLTNGILVCVLFNQSTGTVANLRLDSVAGATFTKLQASIDATYRTEIWYLLDPPSGAHKIFIETSGAPAGFGVLSSWSNRNTTTPFGTVATSDRVNQPQVPVTGAAGDVIIDALAYGVYTATVPAGQTPLGIDNTNKVASSYKVATGTTTTMGPWTSVGSNNAMMAVALKHA